ncbi:MAG: SPFH domain-containing protein, partial [Verrucomicrobiales bacterium]
MEPFYIIAGLLFVPVALLFARMFGLYSIVNECEAQVFTLFGKVIGTLGEPGLQFPIGAFGLRAILVPFFGKKYSVGTQLRQHYLRNQMVNSEEGTPMGVGIWYEMRVN